MNQYEIDKQRMREAIEYAMEYSQDPDTKSGCQITFDVPKLSGEYDFIFGTNRLPQGIELEDWMLERPAKYDWLEHCERDAIHRAKGSVNNGTLYVNWQPCPECAKAMINAGIKRVVVFKEGQEAYERLSGQNPSEKDWHSASSIDMMERAGIKVDVMSFIWNGQVKCKFRGQEVLF